MRATILAVFAALSLAASCAPISNADRWGRPVSINHQGPYDNTGNGGNRGGGGGGGG